MFPFSPFARPVGSFQIPVPPPTSGGGSCDELAVTFPPEWLPYILGALQQLTLQSTWQGTPAEIIDTQQRAAGIIGNIQKAVCAVAPPNMGGVEVNFDMGIRVDCDCRVFVMCCDGTEVELLTTKNPGPSQPGAGSNLPAAGGGSANYCFALGSRLSAYAPTVVNTGDVITIHGTSGAWNDGNSLYWYCPNGYQFILGTCNNTPITNMGQLLVTARYMSIIAKIGPTYYDVFNPDSDGNPQPFTVPGGVINQPVEFLANFNPGSPAGFPGGIVEFCATIRNNAAIAWSHHLDFRLSPYGFTPYNFSNPGDDAGVWTAGMGWVGVQSNPGHPGEGTMAIKKTFAPCTLATYRLLYTVPGGVSYTALVNLLNPGSNVQTLSPSAGANDNSFSPALSNVTEFQWDVEEFPYTSGTILQDLYATGSGTDPFAGAP